MARNRATRLSLTAQDVGVTGIEDSHGGAAEELTASGTELNLYDELVQFALRDAFR